VVFGGVRWKAKYAGRREAEDARTREGEVLRLEDSPGKRVAIRFEAESPCECLRFEPRVLSELRRGGFLPPVAPSIRSFDPAPQAAAGEATKNPPGIAPVPAAPPRLTVSPRAPEAAPPVRDTGDWVEFGTLALTGGREAESGDSTTDLGSCVLKLEAAAPEPPPERSGPNRRNRDRRPVDLPGRIGLLGLAGAGTPGIIGRLVDLTPMGAGMEFEARDVRHRLAALEQAAVILEVARGPGAGTLRLAGRVRWIERGRRGRKARLGIEFVLVTEEHLAAIGDLTAALA
jgi:hypothetical protein